ncbi:MAG: iron ABC transporter permease [Demequinaceae bacterium]|nr:iron ABC transporter permease [Demequinaceae bacterium]
MTATTFSANGRKSSSGDPVTPPVLRSRRLRAARAGAIALPLTFLGLFFLWPVGTLLWRGLSEGSGDALASERTWAAFGTTITLALAGTVGSLVLGLGAAWALYRVRWRGQAYARALVTVPFVLPTVVVAVAFGALLRPSGLLGFLGLDQGIVPIVAALVFFNVSVVVRIVGGTWASLDPGTAIAARTLGASRWTAFRRITLPALGPGIAAAAAIVFLFCSTSFGIVLILGGTRTNTLETEIWLEVKQFLDLNTAATLALLQVVVVALTLAIAGWAQSRRERALKRTRMDGTRSATRADLRLVTLALAPSALLVGLPLVGLVERSLHTRSGWGFANYASLLTIPERSNLPVPVWRAAVNSLEAAAIATSVAFLFGLILAAAISRSRRARWLDAVAMLPLGVSAVIVGLGILLTLYRPLPGGFDFGDPRILVPAAQAVVALPLVVRSLVPTLRSISPELRSAAATLGANPRRVWWLVDWPILRRPTGVALGLAFAVSLGEFGATSFATRPDHPTLPTAIYRLLSRPGIESVGTAFAACVLLAFLTSAVMMVAERWHGKEAVSW